MLLLYALAAVSVPAVAQLELPSVEFTLHGAYSFGYVDGFVQTPLGGRPGTSSARRPAFDELGIHDGGVYDAGLDARWAHLGFYGGYQSIELDGRGQLASPLVTHGISFGTGDSISARTRFDWFRVGGGWAFEFAGGQLELFPKADVAVLDFDYRLSDASQSTSRSYAKGSVRLGLEVSWQLNHALSLKLDGAASAPISNTPQIATVSALLNWRLLPRSHWFHPALFFGGGAEWIDYQDNQSLPNHVRLDLGPFVTGGLAFTF